MIKNLIVLQVSKFKINKSSNIEKYFNKLITILKTSLKFIKEQGIDCD